MSWEGRRRLDVSIGNVSDLAADLDLVVYRGGSLVGSSGSSECGTPFSCELFHVGVFTGDVLEADDVVEHAERNSGTPRAVFMSGSGKAVRSLTTWGRTGFDGDTSGSWLHAELIAS